MICKACPRKCGAERTETAGAGFCGQGLRPRVARAALHLWEEPCISGKRGSGAIFFSGCTLKCVFCQNAEISHGGKGIEIPVERLAEIMEELEAQGAETINLVTAGHFTGALLQAFRQYRPHVPVVYNSSGYESVEVLRALEGYVDVYLPDLKTLDSRMSGRLFGATDYPDTARQAILEMVRQTGPAVYQADGIMRRGTLIRHLVLPGMTTDSMQVLNWIYEHCENVPVSLMGQYVPCGEAVHIHGLDRRLRRQEYERVLAHMQALGLPGYYQEKGADERSFIPLFDGTGVERIEDHV
ncbi:MAG: radical SAM protein [Clostridia bacterium]|nr:radical SAM protein [Clostridia bacterium]